MEEMNNKLSFREYYRDLRLSSKFLLGYAIVFVTFIFISSLVFYPLIRRNVEENIQNNLDNSTKSILTTVKVAVNVSIQNYLRAVSEQNRDIAQEYYNRYKRGELTEKEAKRRASVVILSQRVGKSGYVYCLNSKGLLEVHPFPQMIGHDLTQFRFINLQIKNKVGYVVYDWKNPGETKFRPKAVYMTYFEPWDWIVSASAYRDEFGGLVNQNIFRESVLSMRFGKRGYAYVMDSKGEVVFHPYVSGNQIDAVSEDGRKFGQEMLARKNGRMTYSWRNPGETQYHRKMAVFNYIPELGWVVVSTSYEEDYYEPLREVRNFFIAMVTLSLAALLVLTLSLSSYMVNSLSRLLRGFQLGGAGDFSIRIPKTSRDEFGRLTDGFNDFMSKLETYNASLTQEIAQRKKADEDLTMANERYKSILRAATSFSIIGTDNNGLITVFNEGAELMLGYRPKEVINKMTPERFHDPEELAQRARELGIISSFRIFTAIARTGQIETREWTYVRKDGSRLPVQLTVTVRHDNNGDIVGYLGVAMDITARKRAESELLAQKQHAELLREQAEAASRAKSSFLANMSHELRTPLNVVIVSADVLISQILGNITDKQREYLTNIKASGSHLLSLINDVLNLSKIEAGKMDLRLKEHRVRDLIADSMAFVRDAAALARIELVFDEQTGQEDAVLADDIRFRQILCNVLSNAVKFTHPAGKVTIRTRRIALQELRGIKPDMALELEQVNAGRDTFLEIVTEDNGIGIKPDDLKKLFKPFSQVEDSNTRNYDGSGLGLIITRKLVELHGGRIWMESVWGEGTTVFVVMPLS